MREAIKLIIVWGCIIMSLASFIRLIVLDDQALGIIGLVVFNLSAIIIFVEGKR